MPNESNKTPQVSAPDASATLVSVHELKSELSRLQTLLDEVERERAEMALRYRTIARETASLATLYVTSYRLLETLDREELLTVLQEAVMSLLGSEAYAIFDITGTGLALAAAMGVSDTQIGWAQACPPMIREAIDSGAIYMHNDTARADSRVGDVAAIVPLCRAGVAEGLVVVFSLLPHKSGFLPADKELLELLRTHVATALYCAKLHAQASEPR